MSQRQGVTSWGMDSVKFAASFLFCTSALWAQLDQGPGGPILVVSSSGNPFTRYYAEILRGEGLNEFFVADISTVSAGTLSSYDVVILGDLPLSGVQVAMFNNYVSGGGNLIAMRPDKQLAGLLGLTDAGGTLAEGYLLVNTSAAPGAGLVSQTIQYHGAADRYQSSGATVVATLYSTATSATSHPAVTLRSFGSGQAAAFTYDLARSVVYTRQGNPAWAGQSRYHPGTPYVADLFYPDWVDRNKMHIPQADEQMRLLSNLIQHMNRSKKPLPRFWYLPFSKKFAVMMTSDDHGSNATPSRFDGLNALSPAGCNVANWECARSTSYIFPSHPAANSMGGYQAQGHEISLHFSPPSLYTPASIDAAMNTQVNQFRAAFPNLNPPVSQRAHAGTSWSDYASQAVAGARYGVRLDHNFMPDPYAYYNANPGFFTGSALVMRFANADGTMIDQYQAPTQVIDGTGQNLPTWPNPILDRGVGAEGFYGFMSVLIHSDYTWQNSAAFAITSAAFARGIPVISARQALVWLDGRNNSSFSALSWSGSRLSFNVNAAAGSNGLRVMLPVNTPVGALNSVLQNGSAIGYTLQTIKGVDYAFFTGVTAAYQAVYGSGGPPPPSVTSVSPSGTGVATGSSVTANFSVPMNAASFNTSTFTLRANGAGANVPASIGASGSTATLLPAGGLAPGTTYTATISPAVTSTSGVALGSTYSWSFTTAAAALAPTVTSVNPTGTGVAIPSAITVTFSQPMNPGSFGASTAGLYQGGLQLGASLSVAGATLTITPSSPLAPGTTYSVSLAGSLTNTSGVPMGSGFATSFTTAAASTGGGLAGWWQFNEGGGGLASDASGNGNTLALNGAVWTAGYSGTALAYNAAVGLASVTPSAVLNNHTEFTWAAWVRPTGEMGRGIGPVIERGAGSDQRRTLSFGPVGSSAPGTVYGMVRAGANAFSEAQLNSYTLNTWAHWAMTYSDSGDRRIHIYRNGVEVSYRAQTPAAGALVPDAGSDLGIGATPGSLFYGFTGTIDDVRIYNRVLSSAELLALGGGVAGPSVVANSPTGSGVPVTTSVVATFDRTMSAGSFTAATFRLRATGASSDVPATVGASGVTATLVPLTPLAAGTSYTATIAGSVSSSTGAALGTSHSWTFTTAAASAPLASSWSPTGTGVSLSPSVTVNFNRTMAAGSFNSTTFTLRASGAGSNVAATVSASGATATLTPAVALAAGSTYVVTVSAAVSDSLGVPLGSNFSWTFTTAAGPSVPAPMGWWNLNEGSGASIGDASGRGSTGTAVNTSWTSGPAGAALSFNGANSVVNLGSPAALTNVNSFTWTLWAVAAGEMSRGIGPVLEKGSGSYTAKSFALGALQSSSPRTVVASVRASGAAAISEAAIGSYDQGVWAHWAITYDDAGDRKIRIYKNGVEVAYRIQTAASGTVTSDAGLNLAMGSTPDSQFFAFNGALDDVRIFNRVLTLAEIQAVAAQ